MTTKRGDFGTFVKFGLLGVTALHTMMFMASVSEQTLGGLLSATGVLFALDIGVLFWETRMKQSSGDQYSLAQKMFWADLVGVGFIFVFDMIRVGTMNGVDPTLMGYVRTFSAPIAVLGNMAGYFLYAQRDPEEKRRRQEVELAGRMHEELNAGVDRMMVEIVNESLPEALALRKRELIENFRLSVGVSTAPVDVKKLGSAKPEPFEKAPNGKVHAAEMETLNTNGRLPK